MRQRKGKSQGHLKKGQQQQPTPLVREQQVRNELRQAWLWFTAHLGPSHPIIALT